MSWMVQQPLVSVIVPFLNAGRFLDEAIQSVFAQTYTRWELLLVDDGSDDGSREIAGRWAEQNPEKVRILQHDSRINRGLSASRNLGIKKARGEFIAFLDADDVWLAHKLHHQVTILGNRPDVDLVCAASLYWYSWNASDHAGIDRVVTVGAAQDAIIEPPRLLIQLYPLGDGAAPCMNSLLARSTLFERLGGFEDDFRGMYEDQIFLARAYLSAQIFVSSVCCDYYRQHSGSMTSEVFRLGQYDAVRLAFLNWLEAFLKQTDCENGEIWDALERALYRDRHPVAWLLTELRSEPRRAIRSIGRNLARKGLPGPAYDSMRRWLARN
jgi:glycosyltransferase involved in cell wall biosynthesis